MKNKEDFPKVVILGMSVVITILIGFPLLAYFCFQDKTKDVIYKNYLDNISQSRSITVIYPDYGTFTHFLNHSSISSSLKSIF